jgi:hypothetical protein
VAALYDPTRARFPWPRGAALAVLLVGVWPLPLLKVMQPTIHHLVSQAIATKV